MELDEVRAVLDALVPVGPVWVAGGWGVDALVGRVTRPHRDLDLLVRAEDERAVLAALDGLGYAVETDWRPVRVELVAPGRGWVDVHPLRFDAVGAAVQAGLDGAEFSYPADCFVTGSLAGVEVGCLSVRRQLAFHEGYEPRAVDRHDLALLTDLRGPDVNPGGAPR
ncbi:nucleotidyltransferase domain-containing protein [Kineococcus gynurae]|uniref:Nucleotidyltransferase domain-containing protein n=1 Tax=Kineococcus gynurae TaxID=452979 RepID=A0ABV5LW74_9ACTN